MIHCRVVTPQGLAREMDTTILNVVSSVGQLGILAHHVPLVSQLEISRLATVENGVRKVYAIAGGLLYFANDQATLLTDALETIEDIELNRAIQAKERAEQRLASQDEHIDIKRAEVALKKAINRIHVKGEARE